MLLDMLVPLFSLPDPGPSLARLAPLGIEVRRARSREEGVLVDWVGKNFSQGWASECRAAMSRIPPACFVALQQGDLMGFACFEAAYRGFFGPMGVLETHRGKGLGRALLICALKAMAESGYQYAIIGEVGPVAFYEKVVSAKVIPCSSDRLGNRDRPPRP